MRRSLPFLPLITLLGCLLGALPAWNACAQDAPGRDNVTRIRYFPRAGAADKMVGGRFSGSITGPTNDFVPLVEIKTAPADGQWTEIKLDGNNNVYRFIKYEAPAGSWGNVAEIEFYSGDRRLKGKPFGTNGSRDDKGNAFSKALDGDTATFFDGRNADNQYVGVDLGLESQAGTPAFSVRGGAYPEAQTVSLRTGTPGAVIRYTTDGTAPDRKSGAVYSEPIKVEKNSVITAFAAKEGLADSPLAVAIYRIGPGAADAMKVTTFHIGNSLTDTVVGWLEPVAASAGRNLAFHRFTIPGAPTDWLWSHPGTGFGDNKYPEAFEKLAPIDHLFTQPFAGHGRSIENEAEHSGKFFDLTRKYSPNVQHWLYVQWPSKRMNDSWARGEGAVKGLGLKPATTWQEGVANHVAYTEAVRQKMDDTHEGNPVRIVPGGTALAKLKIEVDAGRVPGMKDFFAENFSDDVHLSAKGRYLISLVHYACIFKESPEGKVATLSTGLTPEQAKIYQRIAWETVKDYKWAGIKS